MKPPAKRVTIQKPEAKAASGAPGMDAGGFVRVNDAMVRKVYK